MANSDFSIVYMDSDGTLSIIHPADKCPLTDKSPGTVPATGVIVGVNVSLPST